MRNPYFNRQHLKEYLSFGIVAATVYIIPVIFFLYHRRYENFVLPFLGNMLFMFVIFYYAFRLLYRRYDKKRAAVMLIAGHLATAAGVLLSMLLVTILTLVIFPRTFSSIPADVIIKNVPVNAAVKRPAGLLAMLLLNALVGNFGAGSAISVVTAYAGKLNQTKDKPAELDIDITSKNTGRK